MSQNDNALPNNQMENGAEAPQDQAPEVQDQPKAPEVKPPVSPPVPDTTFLVTCVSVEGEHIKVPSHILSLSHVFKSVCESLGVDLGLDVLYADSPEEAVAEPNQAAELNQVAQAEPPLQNGNKEEHLENFDGEFPLGNIKADMFKKVVKWCEEHYGQPDPEKKINPKNFETIHFEFTPFEEKFLDVSVDELQEILMAANFLDIRSLYLYACQKAALMIMGKTQEQVRAEWGFPDDLTEADKEAIKKEYQWAFQDCK
ncbi:skp1 family, dimerization domain-containing protein [Ditylenchus destructor]|uniref:Skp1 family, dimerization domain-containing protein n=1 Tax=Ditylenchus destructor TaxID=166010 RepID=A0AAD4N038_9BILA|nr:skp1 family, dimerization domain-containing protein [Ditylenchus destructor]